MTDVAIPESGGAVALPEDTTGLEDFDPTTDAVMPTIRIEHKKGVFVDGLSNEEFDEFDGILLGLIKQRVLWEADVDESAKGPLCRSLNFKEGLPDPTRFPWKASGFDPKAFGDNPRLPCESCVLKDWGSHPKRDAPWCSEQHTFAVLQSIDGSLAPALLTVQRSAIKPSRTYLTSFQRTRTALYTVRTRITLDSRHKGTVDYAVPKFIRSDATDQADWPMFAQQYRQIREFVQTPRLREDDDADVVGAASPTAASTGEAPASSAPTVAPGVATAVDDDELPF